MTNLKRGHTSEEKFRLGNTESLAILVFGILLVLFTYNSIRLSGYSSGLSTGAVIITSELIPKGIPAIYGSQLGISYDDVSPSTPSQADATISVMGNLDRTMTLEGDDLQRYIGIVGLISCEYCCGAKSIIFSDGQPACGCAHSYAMRGLAKYLIVENGEEFTDDEILSELGKWKVLYFPGIHETKAAVLESKGIDSTDYINLASNKYRGIEKGQQSNGGMVGGC